MASSSVGCRALTTYTFDDASQVTGIHHHTSGGTMRQSFAYSYDDAGLRTGVVEGSGDRVTWSYDSTWRLTREQRSGTNAYDITYSYDPVGNRQTKLAGGATTTYTYNAGDALTLENAAGTLTTYSWDNAGNNTLGDLSLPRRERRRQGLPRSPQCVSYVSGLICQPCLRTYRASAHRGRTPQA